MNADAVFQVAEAAGLARDWTDAVGKPQQVAPEALVKILESLGFACRTQEQCRDSLNALHELRHPHELPPLVTGRVGQAIRLPPISMLAGLRAYIELEDGSSLETRLSDHAGELELPVIDKPGYHRLLVDGGETTLAVAPLRCFGVADALEASRRAGLAQADARLWGLGVQLYSLRRRGDGGIGDFTALSTLARRLAERGAGALAISPVHAMFSADLHRYSPYGPSSRLFVNAMHIDPAAVLGEDAYRAVLADLGGEAMERAALLEASPLIDWPRASSLKLEVLRKLFEVFEGSGRDRREFEVFRHAGGEALQSHARFEAMHAWRLERGESAYWLEWPDEFRNARGAGVESFARDHAREIEFHEFLQWQAARGVANAQKAAREGGMPIGLITDLAVGADNGGSQAWSRRDEIIHGLSVGAPPDVVNSRGQAWGLGAYSPYAMRRTGFRAYIEMLRAAFAYAGGVRIDHVLGLKRLWLVPNGESPQQGAYLQYPMEDLLRLIALESWRHRAIVIGEDLGTVPEGFEEQLAAAGLLGIRVLLFQRDGKRFLAPSEWSSQALATTTTHDLPTLAGWWEGRDIGWRVKLDLLEKGQSMEQAIRIRRKECESLWQAFTRDGYAEGGMPALQGEVAPVDPAVAFMADSPSPLAMLPVEDALGLAEQPNLPGTVDEHPNWRRRLPFTVEELPETDAVSRRIDLLNRTRHHRSKS